MGVRLSVFNSNSIVYCIFAHKPRVRNYFKIQNKHNFILKSTYIMRAIIFFCRSKNINLLSSYPKEVVMHMHEIHRVTQSTVSIKLYHHYS